MGQEKTLENQLKTYLNTHGAWFIKTWAGANSSLGKGTPDILCCWHGHFVSIEVKRPDGTGKITPVQKATAKVIAQAGGIATFISSLVTLQMIEAYLCADQAKLDRYPVIQRRLLIHCGADIERDIYKNELIEGIW